jgi:outer membrane protein OmpA-like peptidoglycan-associated protein
MRHFLLSLAVLLFLAAPALAQVTVDLHALDALPPAPVSPTRHPPLSPLSVARPSVGAAQPVAPAGPQPVAPAGRPAVAAAPPAAVSPPVAAAPSGTPQPAAATSTGTPAAPRVVATVQPTAPAPSGAMRPPPAAPPPGAAPPPPVASQPPPPAATLPVAPPAVASIAPIQPPAPPANASPPPAPPIAATAATTAAATPAGVRLSFAANQSDLSPGSADSIKQMVQTAPTGDATTFNVLAYASGDPDDPSAARRLSLARAIAVRAVLMADGVPSSRIYLRALGSEPGQGPADRVDLSVLGVNASQR